ncbi:hypothetical protein [Halorientalis halophila]|uniref:hypothetical protein n=1 Tax=Halorientalis halophila TaxID=3108499 RepID=UPI003009021A
MSRGGGRAKVAGVVGLVGVTLTLVAGYLQRVPELAATVARLVDLFVGVAFRIAVIAVFCLGFVVIVYSVWHQRRGNVDEARARRIAFGVAAVLALSLFFPLVVLDELLVAVGGVLARTGVDLPETALFIGSLAVFGSLTVFGAADAVRRRRG